MNIKVSKELVQDIRQSGVITWQLIIGLIVRQCLDTITHTVGVVVNKLLFNALFIFMLSIPDASLEISLCFTVNLSITSHLALRVLHSHYSWSIAFGWGLATFSVKKCMYPRTEKAYPSKSVPSANKSQSVIKAVLQHWGGFLIPHLYCPDNQFCSADPWSISYSQSEADMVRLS